MRSVGPAEDASSRPGRTRAGGCELQVQRHQLAPDARIWRISGLGQRVPRHLHRCDRDTHRELDRVGVRSAGVANEIVDQRAAALWVVEEWGVATWDDLEPSVEQQSTGALTDLWSAVGVLVAPDH